MATILTLTANTLVDHLAKVAVQKGKVARVERFEQVAGGKGLNVGRVLARLGHRVVATGFAGGASGALLNDLVAADGMEPAFVQTAARTRVGFLCVDPVAGGNTSVLESGFAVTAAEVGALVAQVRRLLSGVELCIVSGSVPAPSCVPLYRLVLEACHQASVTCWIDAYGPAMDEALAGAHPPALAKPNRDEYGPEDRRWRWLPVPELHLTAGADAVHVRHPAGRWRIAPPSVQEVNPIGSGDCYLAALAHARLAGWALADQLTFAAAAGAANAEHGGVARIGLREIESMRGRVTVRPAGEND